jgi:signal transduction histidine kinase
MHVDKPIRIARISDHPKSIGFPQNHPPMNSFLGVPIRQGDIRYGQIYLTEKIGADEFSAEDEQVIETLASYGAIAIANVRLYSKLTEREEDLTHRNENLALLNDLASTLATSADVDQILDKAITQVMDYLRIEVGEVFLRQEEGNSLRLVLHRGNPATSIWQRNEYRVGNGLVGQVAKNGQPYLVSVPCDEPDLNSDVVDCFHQVILLPLTGRRGVLGVLTIASSSSDPLDETDMQFLSTISSWVGTVIENVRLNLQQRRLAVLEERERIGMDLHDGIIQSIYAVGLTLEHARLLMREAPDQAHLRIENAISDLNSTIRDIRAYILDLRPRQLHDEDLMQGLARLVKEFHTNTLVDIHLNGPMEGQIKLPESSAIALFHICQEGLANVAKHARAKHVEVVLWATQDRVLLEISDDGKGFDQSRVRLSLGHGLSNMQTRAHNVGGDVEISSEPASGTTILAWVPAPES